MYNLETGKTVIELYDGEIDAVLEAIENCMAFPDTVSGDPEYGEALKERYFNLYRTRKKQKEEAK